MLTLAVVDATYAELGTEVTFVWGEEGGTAKPTVEPHVQTEIRAGSAPSRTAAGAGHGPTPRSEAATRTSRDRYRSRRSVRYRSKRRRHDDPRAGGRECRGPSGRFHRCRTVDVRLLASGQTAAPVHLKVSRKEEEEGERHSPGAGTDNCALQHVRQRVHDTLVPSRAHGRRVLELPYGIYRGRARDPHREPHRALRTTPRTCSYRLTNRRTKDHQHAGQR